MSDYEYDPDLPYVVAGAVTGMLSARFRSGVDAEVYAFGHAYLEVIDTTPKPRVPEDAQFITYQGRTGLRFYARRALNGLWIDHDDDLAGEDVQSLPCVTPDTVFTVLDERKQ